MKKFIVVFDVEYASREKMSAAIVVEAESAVTAGLSASDILPDYLSADFDGATITKITEIR